MQVRAFERYIPLMIYFKTRETTSEYDQKLPQLQITDNNLIYQEKNIIDFFAHCKGGYFNIHIRRRSAISSAKQGKSGSIYNLVKNK